MFTKQAFIKGLIMGIKMLRSWGFTELLPTPILAKLYQVPTFTNQTR
jgi:hypothetical protein